MHQFTSDRALGLGGMANVTSTRQMLSGFRQIGWLENMGADGWRLSEFGRFIVERLPH